MDFEAQQPIEDGRAVMVKHANAQVRLGFVRKVYGILSAQLMLTVLIAAPLQRLEPEQLSSNSWLLAVSIFTLVLGMCAITCCKDLTRSYPTNYIVLLTLTVAESVLVGFSAAAYTWQSVMVCVGLTACIFAGLTIFAFKTKSDFTGSGQVLLGGIVSLISWGLMLLFLSALRVPVEWGIMLYDLVATFIFVGYIIYDTQLIIGGEHKAHQFTVDDYVFAAINIYLDIVQLFLRMLRLVGKRK
eukprot:TRINITY_DN8068_c0_g1_i6.p1 TRINITY_DN8068_c0_g1~~TRINITY_DN8068_c0_g1_i6.p1  ORF type:complete len:243 (-),score=38.75 TRINITY_DN8068_c0_g1_i6:95-823(-)